MKLVRFRTQESEELGDRLHELVWSNKPNLKLRRQFGALAAYGHSLKRAKRAAEQAVAADLEAKIGKAGVMSYLAISDTEDTWYGVVELHRGAPLRRARVPLPVGVLRMTPGLVEDLPLKRQHTVRVVGWTIPGNELEVGPMYGLALDKLGDSELPWALEPRDSREGIHEAIQAAGLPNEYRPKLLDRYLLDEDRRNRIPPVGRLFIAESIFSDPGVG